MDKNLTVYEALNAVMNDVTFIGKNQSNEHQNFDFRGIDDVMQAFGPSLRKHGVIAVPRVLERFEGDKRLKNSVAKTVDLIVAVDFYGPAGDCVTATVAAEAFDSGDKATAKAMSVALRTAFLQVFCLPTNEPDPDSYTYEIVDQEGRSEFIARMRAITDVSELRKLQSQAKRWDAEAEWLAFGKKLAGV